VYTVQGGSSFTKSQMLTDFQFFFHCRILHEICNKVRDYDKFIGLNQYTVCFLLNLESEVTIKNMLTDMDTIRIPFSTGYG